MSQPLYSNAGFEQPLEIKKGSTVSIGLELVKPDCVTPFDLTDFEIRAGLIPLAGGAQIPFTVLVNTDPADGKAIILLEEEQTAELVSDDSVMPRPTYRWACELRHTPTGDIVPFCQGSVLVVNYSLSWS